MRLEPNFNRMNGYYFKLVSLLFWVWWLGGLVELRLKITLTQLSIELKLKVEAELGY